MEVIIDMPRESTKVILNLLKEYLKIYNSEKNKRNKKYFRETKSIILNRWRGIPKKTNELEGKIPFVYWIGEDFWRAMFNIDFERLYTEPLYYLENWLKIKLFYFKNFDDCNCYENFIPIWLGTGFEASLFGSKRKYSKNQEPVLDPNYILIKDYKDLDKLREPSFYDNEHMKIAIKFYKDISRVVNDYGIEVGFVEWQMGPTNICSSLRGFENLFLDFILNKKFVKKLIDTVVKSQINWSKSRDNFLGYKRKFGAIISNDEVSTPNLSPKIYSDLIFPYEYKICKYFGGFRYYHNCGPIDPFLEKISEFRVDLMHSGPYSDYKEVGKIFFNKAAIEVYLPKGERLDGRNFRNKLLEVKKNYSELGVESYYIRWTNYYNSEMSINGNIEYLKEKCSISKKVLLNN